MIFSSFQNVISSHEVISSFVSSFTVGQYGSSETLLHKYLLAMYYKVINYVLWELVFLIFKFIGFVHIILKQLL